MKPQVIRRSGIKRLVFTLVNSGRGLRFLIRHEEAFQLELVCAAIMIPAAILLAESSIELSLLLGSVFMVLIVEVLNTAVEALTDRVSLDFHELSGRAKDLGSLAVTLSLLLCALVWGIILVPRWAI